MRGSLLLLFGAAAIYLVVALGIGLWISTLVETQQQAMFVTFFIDEHLPADERPVHADRQHGAVGAGRVAAQPGAALRDDLARDSDQGRRAWPRSRGRCVMLAAFGVVTLTLAIRQYSKRVA